MSGFVANELSAFCGGGKPATGYALRRFPTTAALWRTPQAACFISCTISWPCVS